MHPAQIQMIKFIKKWNEVCETAALEDTGGLGVEFWMDMIIPIEESNTE